MKELLYGYYGTRIYLPLSGLSRKWRRFSSRIRGKDSKFLQQVNLPTISWKNCTDKRVIRVWEEQNNNGNIRISELAMISAIASSCEKKSKIFEIGTFDGRTTLNLALSAPAGCKIYTLDLPPKTETKYALASGERHMVDKPIAGARYQNYKNVNGLNVNQITQLYGDSADFDFTPYQNSCSLIFVDGSHAYEYAVSDTYQAMKMVKRGGIIIWHDYGIWDGVTKALEELEEKEKYGLKNITGTSLVCWKNQ